MLPSHRLELRALRYLRMGTAEGWRPTTLPELANAVDCQDWREVTDAVVRLHSQGVIRIRKWEDVSGFVLYQGEELSKQFFHRGAFQVSITPNGRTYLEALEAEERLEQTVDDDAAMKIAKAGKHLDVVSSMFFIDKSIPRIVPEQLKLQTQLLEAFQQAAQFRVRLDEALSMPSWIQASRMFEEVSKGLAISLTPIANAYAGFAESLATSLQSQMQTLQEISASHALDQTVSMALDQTKAIESMNLMLTKSLPAIWPADILAPRLGLVEDALRNASVFEKLRGDWIKGLSDSPQTSIFPDTVGVAGQLVFDHALFVRRLPPSVPTDEAGKKEENKFFHRDEEIGAKLEERLQPLDPKLRTLRRRSWENLAKGDIASARLAAAEIRELFTEVLHLLAPDKDVTECDIWRMRTERELSKPTRRMRIEFIVGPAAKELNALVQFTESVDNIQKFTHSFADDPEIVRVALAQLENLTYLLLISKRSKN